MLSTACGFLQDGGQVMGKTQEPGEREQMGQGLDYIAEKGQHFIPLDRIPVMPPSASLSDSLGQMKEYGCRGVIVRGADTYHLLLHDQIAAERVADLTQHNLEGLLDRAVLLSMIDVSATPEEAISFYVDGPPFPAAGVQVGGELVGLLTDAEDLGPTGTAPPRSYVCENGHNYYPPPPAKCAIDGTFIRLA
jgi:CBS domain-containing protein